MRQFTKAALAALLSTSTVASLQRQDFVDLDTSAVFFHYERDSSIGGDGLPLTLRIDVPESGSSCDPEQVTLYGQPFAANNLDSARGSFSLPDDTPITATWAFSCSKSPTGLHAPRLQLLFNLEAVHEQPTTAHFRLTFEYRASGIIVDRDDLLTSSTLESPVEIFNKLGQHDAVLVQGPGGLRSNNEPSEVDIGSLPTQELTRKEGHGWVMVNSPGEEEHTTQESESFSSDDPSAGSKDKALPTNKSSSDCHSWRCFLGSATHGLKGKVSHMYHGPGHSHSPGSSSKSSSSGELQHSDTTKTSQTTPAPTSGGETFQVIQNLAVNSKMQPLQPVAVAAAPSPVSTARFLESIPTPDQDLMMTLNIAAAVFLIFSILSITIWSTRLSAPTVQILPLHRETREERLARVSERRRAAKQLISRIFCGLISFEEKTDDQGSSSSSPQGRDLRGENNGGYQAAEQVDIDTTMEEELARFREAASMVSNLVAAEEGRNNQVLQRHLQQQDQGSVDPRTLATAYPAPDDNEVPPPAYENDAADSSMVADGFRYTPNIVGHTVDTSVVTNGLQYSPGGRDWNSEQGSLMNSSNSDRLGYGNKD